MYAKNSIPRKFPWAMLFPLYQLKFMKSSGLTKTEKNTTDCEPQNNGDSNEYTEIGHM